VLDGGRKEVHRTVSLTVCAGGKVMGNEFKDKGIWVEDIMVQALGK
jgi:hypothetical protein